MWSTTANGVDGELLPPSTMAPSAATAVTPPNNIPTIATRLIRSFAAAGLAVAGCAATGTCASASATSAASASDQASALIGIVGVPWMLAPTVSGVNTRSGKVAVSVVDMAFS